MLDYRASRYWTMVTNIFSSKIAVTLVEMMRSYSTHWTQDHKEFGRLQSDFTFIETGAFGASCDWTESMSMKELMAPLHHVAFIITHCPLHDAADSAIILSLL